MAHRLGKYDGKARNIVVKLDPELKSKLFENKKKLAEKCNEADKKFFVNTQLPDQWVAERRERRQQIREVQETARKEKQAVNIEVHNRQVHVNNHPDKKYLQVPRPKELFVDTHEQEKIDKINMTNSDTQQEKDSTFTAYVVKCSSMTEVRRSYVKLKQMFSDANHIMAAYTLRNGEGYQDDREYGSSSRILSVMRRNETQNLAIFVVRYFGGIRLGPKCHDIIETAVTEAIAKVKTSKCGHPQFHITLRRYQITLTFKAANYYSIICTI